MIQRISTLVSYLIYRLVRSMTALIFTLAGFAYYWLAFLYETPEPEYFTIVIGFFGLLLSFFATLSVASKANEAKSYPLFIRLESRTEFLIALTVTSLLFSLALQLIMAAIVIFRNEPQLTMGHLLEIPPIWLSLNILATVVALQASEFIAYRWSRVWVFGLLAVAMVIGDADGATLNWLAGIFRNLAGQTASGNDTVSRFSEIFNNIATFLTGPVMENLNQIFGSIFWPFQAILDGVLNGYFTTSQALAPALILIFASVLFLLAADFFSSRDMILKED